MIVIYFKVDGEIHQVAPGYKSIEEYYGCKAEEFKKIFDYLYFEDENYFLFNNFYQFEIVDKQLIFKDSAMKLLMQKAR